ncbi:hypothetical protein BC939DRAFT_457476 [Gamsiella multidivaricata]|uniref:uncharacterized protein n=1 Tax=Gamsiella multidivaricata TaxID=101098 RepID=UPI00221E68FA|nr:uncharacterized protein BC939DRAFT_457476 [Gamsiella multidivaricata]KAI7820497.1 hypothetical protein BC939DRAFT_457476 [Gamsiella multidivaricata]
MSVNWIVDLGRYGSKTGMVHPQCAVRNRKPVFLPWASLSTTLPRDGWCAGCSTPRDLQLHVFGLSLGRSFFALV